jgi:hypothetical protein
MRKPAGKARHATATAYGIGTRWRSATRQSIRVKRKQKTRAEIQAKQGCNDHRANAPAKWRATCSFSIGPFHQPFTAPRSADRSLVCRNQGRRRQQSGAEYTDSAHGIERPQMLHSLVPLRVLLGGVVKSLRHPLLLPGAQVKGLSSAH